MKLYLVLGSIGIPLTACAPAQVLKPSTTAFVATPAQVAEVILATRDALHTRENCPSPVLFGMGGRGDANLEYYSLWYKPWEVTKSTETEIRLLADPYVKATGILAQASGIEVTYSFVPKGQITDVAAEVMIYNKNGTILRNPGPWVSCVVGIFKKVGDKYKRL